MGLSNFPSASEGVLPVLVMKTILSVALLKNMMRSLLHVVGAAGSSSTYSNFGIEDSDPEEIMNARESRMSITQFKSLCHEKYSSSSCEGSAAAGISDCCSSSNSGSGANTVDCCVCLSGFEADEEVSELSCKHFFHKGCLEKWFDSKHTTCPLCRSVH